MSSNGVAFLVVELHPRLAWRQSGGGARFLFGVGLVGGGGVSRTTGTQPGRRGLPYSAVVSQARTSHVRGACESARHRGPVRYGLGDGRFRPPPTGSTQIVCRCRMAGAVTSVLVVRTSRKIRAAASACSVLSVTRGSIWFISRLIRCANDSRCNCTSPLSDHVVKGRCSELLPASRGLQHCPLPASGMRKTPPPRGLGRSRGVAASSDEFVAQGKLSSLLPDVNR